MAELVYYCGTMDSGKSTLALQTAHNHKSRGRTGLIFTSKDRAGAGVISSRLGLQSEAIEVEASLDIHKFVVEHLSMGDRIDYIICDEAQFYQPEQIEGLAKIVDGAPTAPVDGASVLRVMTLGVKCGDEVLVTVEGESEEETSAKLQEIVESNDH